MICSSCYVNQAQYKLNGKVLCLTCFNKENKSQVQQAPGQNQNSSAQNLQFEAKDNNQKHKTQKTESQTISRHTQKGFSCPECGFFEEDFIKTGFVGCEQCYFNFKSIDDQINNYQGKNLVHRGK